MESERRDHMQIQRMFEIVYILLQKRRVTAKELAEHFEVSTRTIYRDLDALSMAGIPLYTNKGHQGGIFLMEDYVLHRSMFSEEEQQKLMAALQSYHIADPQDVDSLLTKLSSTFSAKLTNWIDVDFVDWGSDHSANRKFLLFTPKHIGINIGHQKYYKKSHQWYRDPHHFLQYI